MNLFITKTKEIHGEFQKTPKSHLKSCNCPKCYLYPNY